MFDAYLIFFCVFVRTHAFSMATSLHNWSCRLSLFSSKAHLLHHSSSSNWNHTLKNSRKQPLLTRLTALVPSLSNMDKHNGQSDGGACSHHLFWMFIGAELIWKLYDKMAFPGSVWNAFQTRNSLNVAAVRNTTPPDGRCGNHVECLTRPTGGCQTHYLFQQQKV